MRRGSALFVALLIVAVAIVSVNWGKTFASSRREDSSSWTHWHRWHREYEHRENSLWKAKMQRYCAQFHLTYTSEYFAPWRPPHKGSCRTRMLDGYPVPDLRCTPGGFNPSVTVAMLRNPAFRTACIRNQQTSEAEKHATYRWYGLRDPYRNYGDTQVCELDHLVPLELGGADGLGNIWPECGPSRAALENRYFKVKDRVEDYLTYEVKTGKIPLRVAQRGIAENWTQYLKAANRYCATGGRCD